MGRESGGVPSPEKAKVVKTAEKGSKPARIASFDYKQWDKLDVVRLCKWWLLENTMVTRVVLESGQSV